jgi:hypothetical protein
MLKDLYSKMSIGEIKEPKNAFRLLRSSLDASKQLRNSATVNQDNTNKFGAFGEVTVEIP